LLHNVIYKIASLPHSLTESKETAYQEKHPDEKPKYLQKGDFGMPRTGQQKFSHQTDRQTDRCLNVKLEILGE